MGPQIELQLRGRFQENPALRDAEGLLAVEVAAVVQEALTNAIRHAGGRHILVDLDVTMDNVRLAVQDDGRGIDKTPQPSGTQGHFGLVGMRERARRLGAMLLIESPAGGGTVIRLDVPLTSALSAGDV
jgi:signal transduction histidine kinase